jgi:hypothetical protein
MNIFNIFNCYTLLLFIRLNTSLKIRNNKSYNKIKMACDYFIEHNLYIYYNDNSYKCIKLNKYRGYYYDDVFFTAGTIEKIKINQLQSKTHPDIIYCNNNTVNNFDLFIKYKPNIDLILLFNNKTWNDIYNIIIFEERYENE